MSGSLTISPSASILASASRTGVGETPSVFASASMLSRLPGAEGVVHQHVDEHVVDVVGERLALGESATRSGCSNALDVERFHGPPDAGRATQRYHGRRRNREYRKSSNCISAWSHVRSLGRRGTCAGQARVGSGHAVSAIDDVVADGDDHGARSATRSRRRRRSRRAAVTHWRRCRPARW